jgi:hypothetical protein
MLDSLQMNLKADWFQEKAADCAERAAAAKDGVAATTLKDMADAWLRLAATQEKLDRRQRERLAPM